MEYNWQRPEWPCFRYELSPLETDLYAFAEKSGLVGGMLKALPEKGQTQAIVDVMIAEAIKTSEIEGEYLSRPDVTSSIRNQVGLNPQPEPIKDLAAKGAAELMVAVRETWNERLTRKTLFSWHRMLLQAEQQMKVGTWRRHREPMQVVSGPIGRQVVHFEGPPSNRVPEEMKAFIQWFNRSREEIHFAPVRAGLAHLYFESIHPFEDGNGRIGRALAEKALSQGLNRPVLLSLSRTIEAQKKDYYNSLKSAQRSLEVTPWLQYFLKTVLDAQTQAEIQVDFVLRKTRFFDRHKDQLSGRQLKVLRRMLDEGPDGFKGGINASKYANLTRSSKATATRDLQDLLGKDVLISIGGGRSTRYELNL